MRKREPGEINLFKRREGEKDQEEMVFEEEEKQEQIERERREGKEYVRDIYDDLYERDFFPVNVLQGSNVIELIGDRDIYGVESGRPFMVIEIAKTAGTMTEEEEESDERAIYKREIRDKPYDNLYQSIKKEAIIYHRILPKIYDNLPEDIKERVVFPRIIDDIKEGDKTKAIILEKMDGYICGNHDTTKKGVWNEKDIEAICFLIKEFQETDPEEIQNSGFELPYKDFLKSYQRRFNERSEPVRALMGEEYVSKVEGILHNIEEVISRQSPSVLSEDIFCFNTIKMSDGRNAFIDWERPYLGNDVSADYGKLISRLWTDPEMQQEAIRAALRINQDNPDFKSLLRASLIFGEGGHMFRHYFHRLNSENLQKREEAEEAVEVFRKLFEDILDNKGAWEE